MAELLSIRWLLWRLRQLRPAERLLLAQAAAWLLIARLALWLIPVRSIIAWKQRPLRMRHALRGTAAEERIQAVVWAVTVVARRSPIRFVCFPQSLAGHALLAARGIQTRLHYGADRTGGTLETHTWLEAGGRVILGGEEAKRFTTLAVY